MDFLTRRAAFSRAGAWATGVAGGAFGAELLFARSAMAANEPPRPGVLNVRDFGAAGDGTADDTAAFQKAIDAAFDQGGNIVFAPTGKYLFEGVLHLKKNVVLEGVFRAPVARVDQGGTTLLAKAGKGDESGAPFITFDHNATLKGVSIFYPDQEIENIVPYPWTLMGNGDNMSVIDVLIVNPWQAVNLTVAGRHFISGLYAHPLKTGILIDACYDVGRIENVHFWPFWADDLRLHAFTSNNLEAFVIGKTDWEYMSNCFTIFPKVGFRFIETKAGQGNVVLTTCGSDVGPLAVQVDACMPGAGITFVNGQFMSTVHIAETNRGTVKFTGCGFWGTDQRGATRMGFPDGATRRHAVLRGNGHTTFNGCHFYGWDQFREGDACIHAHDGGLTVTACEFMEEWPSIILEEKVEAAIVTSNRFNDKAPEIVNRMNPERCQIGFNVRAPRSGRRNRDA